MGQRQRGQAITENIIMVALIAIAAIAVVSLFGDNLRRLMGGSADALSGVTEVQNRAQKSSVGTERRTLSNFGEGAYGGGGGGSNSGGGGGGPGTNSPGGGGTSTGGGGGGLGGNAGGGTGPGVPGQPN